MIDPILRQPQTEIQRIKNLLSKLEPTEQEKILTESIGNRCKKDLYFLSKNILNFKELTWTTHGRTIECLESPNKRKLICLPRGCFKSTLGSIAYPIWLLIKDPSARILLDSEIYTNSKNFIRIIRAILESREMRSLFGEFKSETWNEGEIIIKQRQTPRKEASITAGGIGTVKVGQHYDYIIHDDLNGPSNSLTPELRQKVIDHYKMNVSILEPSGTMIVIGTRYAADDIIGWIIQNEIEEPEPEKSEGLING